MMVDLYAGILLPHHPMSKRTPNKHARNAEIRARHQKGESIATLAEVFGIPSSGSGRFSMTVRSEWRAGLLTCGCKTTNGQPS
jgi:hypothetical protein